MNTSRHDYAVRRKDGAESSLIDYIFSLVTALPYCPVRCYSFWNPA